MSETLTLVAAFAGMILPAARSTTPAGFLPCDGTAVSRTTYALLFAEIGTAFGVGDGSTTFTLPDFRGRCPIGDGTGTSLTARTRGQAVGAETHVLGLTEIPAHAHKVAYTVNNAGSGSNGPTPRAWPGNTHNFDSETVGGGLAHNNMQPSLVVKFFIKT